ncbi:11884_t:CDS:2, partial [Ambispora gerdemannii]
MATTEKIKLFDTILPIREWRREQTRKGYTVGLVPTMGALHAGHLRLVNQAKEKCDRVVVSVFVNPAQFAPHEDLDKYPRTLDVDLENLTETKSCDVVFLPSVNVIYPSGIPLEVEKQQGTFVEVKGKSHQMEGKTRPMFFRGVATVCTKLFNIIQPDHVFFGQKDAQQCVVIRSLICDLHFPIVMNVGETLRESDGLAMSSRNKYLTVEMRPFATVLYRALTEAKNQFDNGKRVRNEILTPAYQVIQEVTENVEELGFEIKLDYLSLVDPSTLEEIDVVVVDSGAIISGAVW